MADIKVLIDSDGVLHNFNDHFASFFGNRPNDPLPGTGKAMGDDAMWALIDTVPEFWLHMPLMDDAMDLYNGIKQYDPVVLSGCPKNNYHVAVDFKNKKFARNFPEMKVVLTCPSRYKPIAAAVHLGMLDSHFLAMAQGVFLNEMDEPQLSENKALLKKTMETLDLKGAILIDDMLHICKKWAKAGGRAILHKTAAQTLDDLANDRFFIVRKK